ncbi:NAC domain-containing protein JA2-like [Salvia miltiorrhiza]|uniref:NAC domain-containing protein JA2-like n=1 Tax=Salvia miltiorrhiza TaxID=226208 RepID=UPI0025AC415D|nr:NAC domain-containing protein JA2-like [Salvia miltiorrhiza]
MDDQETEQRHSEDEQIPAPAAPMAVPEWKNYLPGFRFVPTDTELILYYLQKKINNEPILCDGIKDTNLKQVNPWDLQAKFPKLGDDEWYFFTPRDRKYPNGERPDRGSESGYWKATGADKPVIVGDVTVGFKKALVFYQGKPQKGVKTNWIMHEYRVNAAARKKRSKDDMRLDDWVLCRMYEKSTRLTNKRKNPNAKEQTDDDWETAPLENDDDCEIAAAVENLPGIFPENPYPFNYYYHEQNPAYLQDILKQSTFAGYQEANPSFSDVYFQLDGIVAPPVEEQGININSYLNDEPLGLGFQQQLNIASSSYVNDEPLALALGFQQLLPPQPNIASSSTWRSNEASSSYVNDEPSASGFQQLLPPQPNIASSSTWRSNEASSSYVNDEPSASGFQQPPAQPNIASSSTWRSNEAFFPASINTNISPPIYNQIDAQQDMKIDAQENTSRGLGFRH